MWVGGLSAALLGVLAFVGLDLVWTEYLWFSSMGQQNVFWVRYGSQAVVWLVCAGVSFAVTLTSARAAWRAVGDEPRFNGLTAGACFILAAAMGWNMSRQWMVFRLAVAGAPFGLKDPLFGLDVGFFVFTLPAIELFTRWLIGLCILGMVVCVMIVFLSTRLDTSGDLTVDWWRLKRIVSILAGLLTVCAAFNFIIGIWRLSFSTFETPFAGASYSDVHAQIPANMILAVVGVVIAILLFATANSKRFKPVLIGFAIWAVAVVVLGTAWPYLVQTYVATPNEASLELPYISHNIDMTRNAYDLAGVKGQDYPGLQTLSPASSAMAVKSLQDATIWTPDSVKQAFNQLQTIRPYYKLSAIEYDRYEWAGGLHQVLVSARQIDPAGLPRAAQTWVNRHLVYTHGFGLAISSTSRTSGTGFPDFIVGDVPPRITADEASSSPMLRTVEPRIYFGPDQNDWVVVNTGIDEFDYPQGQRNATFRYQGDEGVPVGGFFRKLAWAMRFQSSEMLFSRYLESDSRVFIYRNVVQRARKIAPWLTYDAPYAAIADGRIVWIIDAYTASDHYPYSQPLQNGQNYLRDSVKVTVDALTGDVKFYAIGDDPIRDAWARVFPTVMTPGSELPAAVAKHVRSPKALFSAQASIYRTYHMTDPMVFYNQEDAWQTPLDSSGKPLQPQYVMLDLPDAAGRGMYLLQPYALPNRDNLVGWMATACEPGFYGDRTVYRLPKERVTLGAAQVGARINQDPQIAQQLTLWNQPGNTVLFGNMLVLPIEGAVAYVQPIFLQAQKSAITQLAGVIAVNGDKVELGPTLDAALLQAYTSEATTASPSVQATGTMGGN